LGHEEFVRRGFNDRGRFEAVFGAEPAIDVLEGWDSHREMTTRIAWKPYMYNPALAPLLPMVQVPALVLAGDHDHVAPPDCDRQYANLLPRAELCALPSAGHFADLECPHESAALVRKFL